MRRLEERFAAPDAMRKPMGPDAEASTAHAARAEHDVSVGPFDALAHVLAAAGAWARPAAAYRAVDDRPVRPLDALFANDALRRLDEGGRSDRLRSRVSVGDSGREREGDNGAGRGEQTFHRIGIPAQL